MTDLSGEQRDVRAYLRPVFKRWWLILAVVPIATAATYLHYDRKPKVYTAATQIYVQPSVLNQILLGKGSGTKESQTQNLALLIPTKTVGEEAERLLKKGGKRPVSGGVAASPVETTSFVTITTTASSPNGAARLADAYAEAFIRLQSNQVGTELKRTVKVAERQLRHLDFSKESERREALEDKLQTLKLLAAEPGGNTGIRQVEPAVASPVPIGHNPSGNAIFALVVSLALAIGSCYGLEYLNRKISGVEDAEDVYGQPALTEVPMVGSPAPFEREGVALSGQLKEPFQRLQTNLDMAARDRPLRTILVASAAPNEGKSIVARNLALAYREAGRNVAVLDADLRSATLGGLMAAHQGPGLADILAGRASFGQVVQEVPAPAATNGNGTWTAGGYVAGPTRPIGYAGVVPAGEHHGSLSTALASGQMLEALRTAADTYGLAIIDSPPLLAVPDVVPLLSEADGVILVTRIGVSTRDSARRLMRELERVPDLNLLGLVVNGIPSRTYRARSYGYNNA